MKNWLNLKKIRMNTWLKEIRWTLDNFPILKAYDNFFETL
jgi:hypothetical protein